MVVPDASRFSRLSPQGEGGIGSEERIASPQDDGVGSLVGGFGDDILEAVGGGEIDAIGVVAVAALQGIDLAVSRPAVEDIGAAVAEDELARPLPVPSRSVVPVRVRFSEVHAEGEADTGLYGVDLSVARAEVSMTVSPARRRRYRSPIPGEDIGPVVADEGIGSGIAGSVEIGGAGEDQFRGRCRG